MTIPCDKGPVLDRIEKKLDLLTEVVTRQAVQDSELIHINTQMERLSKKVSCLVRWKDRWGGAVIALGAVGTILSTILGCIAVYNWLVETTVGIVQ